MQAVLEVTAGPHSGRKIVLSPGVPVRIGRTPKADYVVAEDTFLSGAHFYVEWSGAQCVMRDLSSSNGTYLNGSRMNEGLVREGDIITAGQSSFALRLDPFADPAAAPPAIDIKDTQVVPSPFFAPAPEPVTEKPLPPPEPLMPASVPLPFGAPPPPPFHAAPSPPVPAAAEEPPAVPPPPPPAPAGRDLGAVERGMLDVLRGLADPIYAVLDSSRAASCLDAARAAGSAIEPLSERSGACVTAVNPESSLAEQLAAEGWGKNWGIYVTSRQPLAIVRNHLRRFQVLLSQDGVEFQFRLHNPALLRGFLPTLNGEEAKTMFGPLSAILMEGTTPDNLLLFVRGPEGTLEKVMTLAPGSAVGA